MASYTYVDTPNANLVCCICRSPFVEPCTTRTCFHTFCYDCIAQAIAINSQCPIDRTPLSLHDLAPADPLIRNLVDEMVVQCPQQRLGCPHTCQRLFLPIHLSDSCQYVEVGCPTAKCTQSILKKNVLNHHCVETVAEGSSDEEPHTRGNKSDGLESDDEGTPQVHRALHSDSPSTSSEFLAAENALLRQRLSALENVVHALRSEMFSVKHALGPWYRPEVLPRYPMEEENDLPTTPSATETQSSNTVEGRNVEHLPEPPSSTLPPDPSDLASYFPSLEDATRDVSSRQRRSRAATDASRTQYPSTTTSPTTPYPATSNNGPSVGFGSRTIHGSHPHTSLGTVPSVSLPQGSALPTASQATVTIPTLDPTTSLADTLASLHASLVTLAGSLSALAVARSSESLRTAEEIRGMRAAMHGLRMQIHDMLTSRSYTPGQGLTGSSGGSADSDGPDTTPLGMGAPPWQAYLPRPYGQYPLYSHLYPPPPLGMAHPPPTNITKL
ncbi:hypothetical protein C8Q77DRAFT_1056985 [Trametes polyzona]|nr:hypothetical protein C8Q77DRAFT_1056985 [Trametes polyzona]